MAFQPFKSSWWIVSKPSLKKENDANQLKMSNPGQEGCWIGWNQASIVYRHVNISKGRIKGRNLRRFARYVAHLDKK
jgi:hypothetical protein